MATGAPVAHPRAIIRTRSGKAVTLPFAPQGYEATGFARSWQQVDRPSRKSVMVDTAPGLEQVSFSIVVSNRFGSSIAQPLKDLMEIAREPNGVVTVTNLSGFETGKPWRMAECNITVRRREHGTNEPSMAEVSFTFVELADIKTRIARSGRGGGGGR